MISEASYDRIVNAIYEAALDPKVWSEVIHELLASFQTLFASVYTPFAAKAGFEPIWSTNADAQYIADYTAKYASNDILSDALWARVPVREFSYCLGDLFQNGEFEAWDCYKELIKPRGVEEVIGALVDAEDHRAVQLHIYFPKLSGSEISAAKAVTRRLGNHVAHAARVHWHLTAARQQAGSARITLDMFRCGVIWLSEAGAALFRNAEADRILALRDGITLAANGALMIGRQSDLASAIHRAREGAESCLAVARDGAPLFVRVASLPERAAALRLPDAAAIAFISESEAPMDQKVSQAVRLYHLTPAETRVLKCLVTGLDVGAMAGVLGTATSTVRTQVKSILAKCGATRQAELIRLVAMLV